MAAALAHVLVRDPDLAGGLEGERLRKAERDLIAPTVLAFEGPWEAEAEGEGVRGGIGLRLLMLMWHLADRWGRVTPEGIRIPLRLTHQLLADLVASRRPSVTTALTQLVQQGHISKHGDAWLLHGEPPVELYEVPKALAPRA